MLNNPIVEEREAAIYILHYCKEQLFVCFHSFVPNISSSVYTKAHFIAHDKAPLFKMIATAAWEKREIFEPTDTSNNLQHC